MDIGQRKIWKLNGSKGNVKNRHFLSVIISCKERKRRVFFLARKENDPNEDGLLEAWELKDLDLNADMVILSACDTARGRVSAGEGVVGMTWAAFIAEAPTTVATQWKVESASTTELMLEFHRQLLSKRKVSKSEALRRAELKLLKGTKYRHPAYWAAFVLVGEGS